MTRSLRCRTFGEPSSFCDYHCGFTSREIAAAMGLAAPTVRFHLMMARRALRRALLPHAARLPRRRFVPMLADAAIRAALDAMMNAFDVPQVPLHAIKRRAAMPRATAGTSSVALRAVSAAAAALVVVLTISPARTLGWIASAEERIARILQWAPPPPPPKALEPSIAARTGDLAQIQARVSFRIVPPSGLPSGVIRERLWTTPTLVYSKVTRNGRRASPRCGLVSIDRAAGRSHWPRSASIHVSDRRLP